MGAMSADNSTSATVDLDSWVGDVDRYALDHGLSREAAAVALVRAALTGPLRNSVGSTAPGSKAVLSRDMYRDINA